MLTGNPSEAIPDRLLFRIDMCIEHMRPDVIVQKVYKCFKKRKKSSTNNHVEKVVLLVFSSKYTN